MVRLRVRTLPAALLALAACAQDAPDATQLVLVADSDIAAIDAIEFRVQAQGIAPKSARATRSATGAPAYLTLFREDGPIGPLTVSAVGLRGELQVIARSHSISFVDGETRVVPLHLTQSCVGRPCNGQTCADGRCVPLALDSADLLPWTGSPPALAMMTQCGTSMIDLQTDPDHCGACGAACPATSLPNAVPSCNAGSCGIACQPTFAQCDDDAANGCESLLTEQSCGSCEKRCNAQQRCVSPGICMKK
jgi:hypothetical protein